MHSYVSVKEENYKAEQSENLFLEAERARIGGDLRKAKENYLSALHCTSNRDLKFRSCLGLSVVYYLAVPPGIRRGVFHLRRALQYTQTAGDRSWVHFYLGAFYDLRANKILIYKGKSASWRRWFQRARLEQEQVLQLDPAFKYRANVLKDLARKEHFLDGNLEKSKKLLQEALQCEPLEADRVIIHTNMAVLLLEQGDYKAAFENATKVLDAPTDPLARVKALWLAGSCKVKMGANKEGLEFLQDAWELSREVHDETGEIENVKIEILRWLANRLYAKGMYSDARMFVSELTRLLKRRGGVRHPYAMEAERLSRAISTHPSGSSE